MCQHQAGINSAGLEMRKENPSWGSMGLGIPGERHSSSGASPATAFLAGAGLHMGITLGSMYSCSPSPLSHPLQQTCAVCLEDFKVKEELGVLPCQHAFHRK